MPSSNSPAKQSDTPQDHHSQEPIDNSADDFEPAQQGGPEEQPNEPAGGDGAEGYPIHGGDTEAPGS